METVQMNVRIPGDLKAAGDDVFSRIGWSATKAVRTLWEFAARHAGSPTAVLDTLVETSDEETQERQRKVELARAGQRIIPDLYASMGVSMPEPQEDDPYYKEAIMEAIYEHEMEKVLV